MGEGIGSGGPSWREYSGELGSDHPEKKPEDDILTDRALAQEDQGTGSDEDGATDYNEAIDDPSRSD